MYTLKIHRFALTFTNSYFSGNSCKNGSSANMNSSLDIEEEMGM